MMLNYCRFITDYQIVFVMSSPASHSIYKAWAGNFLLPIEFPKERSLGKPIHSPENSKKGRKFSRQKEEPHESIGSIICGMEYFADSPPMFLFYSLTPSRINIFFFFSDFQPLANCTSLLQGGTGPLDVSVLSFNIGLKAL